MTGDSDHPRGGRFVPADRVEAALGASMASPGCATALDLRHLTAPEPMARALAAADALSPGVTLTVLTPMVPTPLLHLLASRGLDVRAQRLPDGSARVTIRQFPTDERAACSDDDGQARP